MRFSRIAIAAGAVLTVAGALSAAVPAAAARAAAAPAPAMRQACPPRADTPRCLTWYAPQAAVNRAIAERAAGKRVPAALTTPAGVGATDIESAYKLPVARAGAGQTVAIVDAYSTPHLASDLAVYRNQYGLPPCTAASGCLRIVNQQGNPSPLPRPDPTGWGVEETLDVSMVSAACPLCKIIVVEATQSTFADLGVAEDTAVRLGAPVVSNSYGNRENGFTQAYAKHWAHPGHVIVASTGDYGYTAAQFPANLGGVVDAGGTQLAKAGNARGWTETVWNDNRGASGSGCSAYVAKPSWQHDTHCPGRTSGDVAAVAANIALYDSSLPKGSAPGSPSRAPAPPPRSSPGSTAWPATRPRSRPVTNTRTPARCSTSPGGTTTGSTAVTVPRADTTTCAWPSRATTLLPASAPRTAPAPSRHRNDAQGEFGLTAAVPAR